MVGAEWVLYLLLAISVFSVSLMIERIRFYHLASKGLAEFREKVRDAVQKGKSESLESATDLAQGRFKRQNTLNPDLETEMTLALLNHSGTSIEVLSEVAQDAVIRAKLSWDKNLSVLATIGSNAPFLGLFGTVLGIIKAFHDLSEQSATGPQMVTAGISEALVATAVGLLVAMPAVVAYNLFQRRVKSALAEAEALKSFLVGKLSSK